MEFSCTSLDESIKAVALLVGALQRENCADAELLCLQVPYLQEHYRRYAGPRGFPGRPRGVLMLARETLRGNAPPAPYSRGLAENLNRFIYSPKPVSYTQTDGPLNSHI